MQWARVAACFEETRRHGDSAPEVPASPRPRVPASPEPPAPTQMGYALRFPRVIGFIREDRRPEDATSVAEIISLYEKQGQRKVEE